MIDRTITDQQILKVETFIRRMNYSEALQEIERWNVQNISDKRIMLHERALVFLSSGDLPQARSALLEASACGENISVLRDLACLYYQTGEIDDWRLTYRKLEKQLQELAPRLSLEVYMRSNIVLGKFFEAEGFEAKALNIYLRSFEKLQQEGRSDLYYFCLPQLLRLKTRQGVIDAIGIYYAELISLRKANLNKDICFEIHHSLMHAEMTLVGPDHAWARVLSSLQDPDLPMNDKRLIFYDFIENCLSKGLSLPQSAKSLASGLTEHDSYEFEIHQLAFNSDLQVDWLKLSELASELSWASYLRILMLYLNQAGENEGLEIKNKIQLILTSLDAESKSQWLERMKPFLASKDLTLQFLPSRRTVSFQSKELDLSKKKGMLALLETLALKRSCTVEDVIQRMWNSPYSPEYYHRLRMTAHRLNQLLFDLTSIPKIVEVTADQVSLRPTVAFSSLH